MSILQKSTNQILASLPPSEYERLRPDLEHVSLHLNDVLYDLDDTIHYAYFPDRGLISLVTYMQDGGTVEVGVVGSEGMAGVSVVLNENAAALEQAVVQVSGEATRIKVEAIRDAFKRGGQLQAFLLSYIGVLMKQVAQTAACNRLHTVEERLARWLLLCQDRTGLDELPLTHELLSHMLGTRRAGVTNAAITLQTEGLIRYSRGHISILNRDELGDFACECYSVVKKTFAQLETSHVKEQKKTKPVAEYQPNV